MYYTYKYHLLIYAQGCVTRIQSYRIIDARKYCIFKYLIHYI